MSTKQSVVIVEDDEWLAEQLSRSLQLGGYKPYAARHAGEAIDLIDQVEPAAVVLDVLLMGSTGFALLHELQSHADLAAIPVILCTNLAENLTLDQLKPYGVRRLLDKTTMQPDDIVTAVRSVLL